MADQALFDNIRALDAAGDPVAGAEAYFYESGTSTPLTVYTTSAGSSGSAHPSPLVADANGMFSAVFVEQTCKVDVQDPDTGSSLPGYPKDVVPNALGSGSVAGNISHTPSANNTATNVQDALDNLTDGTATIATANIDGGTIDGTAIGGTTAAAGAFTTLTASSTATFGTVDINGGAIDGTVIGANSAAAGTFTTLTGTTMRVVDELVIEPGEATGGGAIGKIYGSSDDLIFEGTDGAGDYSEIFRFDYSAGRAVFEQDLYANGAAFNGSSNQFPVLAVSGAQGASGLVTLNQTIATDPANSTTEGWALSGYQLSGYRSTALCFKIGRVDDGPIQASLRNGATVGTISVSAGATAYNTSSDYRLKSAAEAPADYDPIERVKELAAVQRFYTWNEYPEVGVELGWYAHELQAVAPRAVTGEKDATDEDGNPEYQGRDDSKLIPDLVAAIAVLTAKVEALEAAE